MNGTKVPVGKGGREAGSCICSHAHSLQLIKGNVSSLLSEPNNAALWASED